MLRMKSDIENPGSEKEARSENIQVDKNCGPCKGKKATRKNTNIATCICQNQPNKGLNHGVKI